MTRQEIFDKVAPALLKQGQKCGIQTDFGFQCKYTHDGRHCAIGFLIPAGHRAMNSDEAVGTLLGACPDLDTMFGSAGNHFLRELQNIHDKSEPEYWKQELIAFAVSFNFNYECIQ